MNASQTRRSSPVWFMGARGQTSDLSVFAIVWVCYVAGAWLSWQSFGATADLAFFPSAGVTVAAMVLLPRRRWWAVVAAVVVGELGVDLAHGLSVAVAGGYAAANVVEPLVGASLFLRFSHGKAWLDRRNTMRWFLVAAVVAGPLAGAALGGLTRAGDAGVVWWDAALHWWIGDGLGVLAVGAPILAMRGVAMPQGRRLYEAVVALCGGLVLTVLVYWVSEIPPSIVLLLPLVWVAFRFGTPGVLVVSAGIAAVASAATAAGHGLFATLDVSPQTRLTMGQLFLATMIIPAWLFAVEAAERTGLVVEREEQRAALQQSQLRRAIGELSERLVAAVSLDDVTVTQRAHADLVAAHEFVSEVTRLVPGVISVFDLELGRQVFASRPSFALGYDLEEVIERGEALVALLHPEDADAFAAYLVSARGLDDGEAASIDYRIRHRDGLWRWFRTTATPLRRTVDGKVAQLSSLSFDVTAQKAHEADLTAAASLDAMRAHMTDTLQDLAGRKAIHATAAEVLTQHLGSGSAHFAWVDDDRTIAEHEMGHLPSSLVRNVHAWGETIAVAIRDGERVVIDEIASDPRLTGTVRQAAAAAGIASVVMHPLRESGRTSGVLVVRRAERHSWPQHELKLIEETAGRTSHAAERDRVRQERELLRRRATLIADVAAGIESQATVEGAAQQLVELLVLGTADYATFETFVPDHQIIGIAHRAPGLPGSLACFASCVYVTA